MAENCEPSAEVISNVSDDKDQDIRDTDAQSIPSSPAKVVVQPGKTKIDLLLKATADAPIMKQKKWSVDPEKRIGWIIEFVRKYLKLDPSESLFLYVNQAFAPSPDQLVRNVYECFGADGRLVLHYCKNQAWG